MTVIEVDHKQRPQLEAFNPSVRHAKIISNLQTTTYGMNLSEAHTHLGVLLKTKGQIGFVSFFGFGFVAGSPPSFGRCDKSRLFRFRVTLRNIGSAGRGQTGTLSEIRRAGGPDRKSTRLNSSHLVISYPVFCLKKKKKKRRQKWQEHHQAPNSHTDPAVWPT